MHPAEKKSPGGTEGASKVGVLAAGFGDGGAEFGERQRAEEGENCADDPRGENDETVRPSRAISAGLRKMPVPIMVPTTMAPEAQAPRPRISSRRVRSRGPWSVYRDPWRKEFRS